MFMTRETFFTKNHSQLAYLDFHRKIIKAILLIFINLVKTLTWNNKTR